MAQEQEKILHKIGAGIKVLRKEKGMTQLDLAEKSDIDVRLVQRLEAGKTDIRVTTIHKIANGFDVSLAEFFNNIL